MGRPGTTRHDVRPARPVSGRAVVPHGPGRCVLRAWDTAQARHYGPFFGPCQPVKPAPLPTFPASSTKIPSPGPWRSAAAASSPDRSASSAPTRAEDERGHLDLRAQAA